jgi:hypothetical protein
MLFQSHKEGLGLSRNVRVLATLLPPDFVTLRQAVRTHWRQVEDGVAYAYYDDGLRLTYVLDLSRLTDDSPPSLSPRVWRNLEAMRPWLEAQDYERLVEWVQSEVRHYARAFPSARAVQQVEAVWLDMGGNDPHEAALELGRVADELIQAAGLMEGRRQALIICVRQAALHPAVQRVLEARFRAIRYGVEAAEFLYSDHTSSAR